MRRLFEGGAYSSNYCNWQLKSLLHLGQIVITFRTLIHLGQNVITFRTLVHLGQNVITFRPSTISPTCNPRHTQLGHPLLYPYSDKKLNPFSPVLIFLLLTWKLTKTNIEGAENTPTVPTNVPCNPRHIKLGHPLLYLNCFKTTS